MRKAVRERGIRDYSRNGTAHGSPALHLAPPAFRSFVVRLAANYCPGTVELLGEHQARDFVRQSPLGKRQSRGRGFLNRGTEPERSAQHEGDIARRIFSLPLEPCRKFCRGHLIAHCVASYEMRLTTNSREQPVSLTIPDEAGCTWAAGFFTYLVIFDRPVSGGARFIILDSHP